MKKILFSFIFLIVVSPLYSNNYQNYYKNKITVFYSKDVKKGWNCEIVGKVKSFSSFNIVKKGDLLNRTQDKNRVTVRISFKEEIEIGDELFIIDKNNLVISRLFVEYKFDSFSFGKMLIGRGNFRFSKEGFRVVKRVTQYRSESSYIYKARGDYFREIGNIGKAMSFYQQAIKHDINNPEAHLELGYLYLNRKMNQFALNEFEKSYLNRARIKDNKDKFRLLKGMTKIKYRQVFFIYNGDITLSKKIKEKYRLSGIKLAKEGLTFNEYDEILNFYLAEFLFKSKNSKKPDHILAKNCYIKTIEVNPKNIVALVALSRLYYKYGNKVKSKKYVNKVLSIDKDNKDAIIMKDYIENYNQKFTR